MSGMVRHALVGVLVCVVAGGPAFAAPPTLARRAPGNAAEAPSATAPTPAPEVFEARLLDQERTIEFHLLNVAANTQVVRYVLGGILLATTGYLSGVYLAQERFATGDVAYIAKGVVGTTGVLFGLGGLIVLAFPGENERAADRYRLMRPRTARQLQDKIIFGESELRRHAQRSAVTRMLAGGLFTAVGIADIVWFIGTGPNTQLNFLAYLGGLYTTLGLVCLMLKSPAEREYDAYQHAKQSKDAPSVTWDLQPQVGGFYAGLKIRF